MLFSSHRITIFSLSAILGSAKPFLSPNISASQAPRSYESSDAPTECLTSGNCECTWASADACKRNDGSKCNVECCCPFRTNTTVTTTAMPVDCLQNSSQCGCDWASADTCAINDGTKCNTVCCCPFRIATTTTTTGMPSCVSLQSIHGKFVYADRRGHLQALTDQIGDWEKFYTVSLGDGMVAFRSIHGKYIYADPQGRLLAKGVTIGEWERFNFTMNSDRTLSLYSIAQERFVYADPHGQVTSLGAQIGQWERFRITSCAVKLPSCVHLKSSHGQAVAIGIDGRLVVSSEESLVAEAFNVTSIAESIALGSLNGKYVYADPAGGVFARGEAVQAWEIFRVLANSDGTISLQSAHGQYIYIDAQGQLTASGQLEGAAEKMDSWEKFSVSSCSSCPSRDYAIDYSPNRCNWQNGVSTMTCSSANAFECGLRLSSTQSFGAGRYSTRMKAAQGPGTASNFYLYTYGRQNRKNEPWNEIDFEVLGNHVGLQTSRIWTNMFVGLGQQDPQFIEVPFDASADFHTYTIDITCCSVAWIVDDVEYRRVDLNMDQHPDMIGAIRYADLQVLLSLWGQDRTTGTWQEQGYLDDNMNAFPLQASFQVTEMPMVNTCKFEPETCQL